MSGDTRQAAASGRFAIGGDLVVNRLGYGAMQLTGKGVWGEPRDPEEAVRVLRRAVELGVTFIDTADSYGPFVSEKLINKALHPYPSDLVIATKAGFTRPGPGVWRPLGRPEYLRQQVELSLRHLGVDHLDLLQLPRIDPAVPLADQVGELALLQQEGKIRHIGLSEVTVDDVERAGEFAAIVSVQNAYNLARRAADPLLGYSQAKNLAFIPYVPLAKGGLSRADGPLADLARQRHATPSQLVLAWLLKRSPVMIPIPGTSTVEHVEENVAAAGVELSDADFELLTEIV